MYGTVRESAPNSSKIAGLSTSILLTLIVGYALSTGIGVRIVEIVSPPITFTPVVEETKSVERTTPEDLPLTSDKPIEIAAPLLPLWPDWVAADDRIVGSTDIEPSRETGTGLPGTASRPALVRTRPVLLARDLPVYPASAIRSNSEGITTLEVCVDANGRTTSATIAVSSSHTALDTAALKWIRNARFTPARLDGAAQAVCGHSVVYEWNLENAR
jgi:protein TonB